MARTSSALTVVASLGSITSGGRRKNASHVEQPLLNMNGLSINLILGELQDEYTTTHRCSQTTHQGARTPNPPLGESQ